MQSKVYFDKADCSQLCMLKHNLSIKVIVLAGGLCAKLYSIH